jgi:WD40 repeat protein
MRVWDPQSGVVQHAWTFEGQIVSCLALSPDGGRVAGVLRETTANVTSRTPVTVGLWDTKTGRLLHHLDGAAGFIAAMAFRPDGDQLAAVGYDSGRIYAWSLRSGKLAYVNEKEDTLTDLAYSPDGQRLATTGYDSRVQLWDTESGQAVLTLPRLGPSGTGNYTFTARVCYSPDGRRIAAMDWSGYVTVWDAGPAASATPIFRAKPESRAAK